MKDFEEWKYVENEESFHIFLKNDFLENDKLILIISMFLILRIYFFECVLRIL